MLTCTIHPRRQILCIPRPFDKCKRAKAVKMSVADDSGTA